MNVGLSYNKRNISLYINHNIQAAIKTALENSSYPRVRSFINLTFSASNIDCNTYNNKQYRHCDLKPIKNTSNV